MLKYNSSIMGLPLRASYTNQINPSVINSPSLKGRSRHKLKDTHPVQLVSISLDMNASQYASWQKFWKSINFGADWFLMDLSLYGDLSEFEVHATKPFSATSKSNDSWNVSLEVEVIDA